MQDVVLEVWCENPLRWTKQETWELRGELSRAARWTSARQGPCRRRSPRSSPGSLTSPWEKCSEGGVSFTRNGDVVYVLVREFPEDGGDVVLKSLAAGECRVGSVELVAGIGPVEWRQDVDGLAITWQ